MTNEELRDKLTRTYGWVNKLAKWRKNQEVNSVYGLRWLQRIHKLQLSLINQFKEDVIQDVFLWIENKKGKSTFEDYIQYRLKR